MKTLLLVLASLPSLLFAQAFAYTPIQCSVHQIYPSISLTQAHLATAKSLADLYPDYNADWVAEYIDVTILTLHNGKRIKTTGNDDQLTQEQLRNMLAADVDTNIDVLVQYIPENNLTVNEPKEMTFSFSKEPETKALFAQGKMQLDEYLKKHIIDYLSVNSFEKYELVAVQFTVDKNGLIDEIDLEPYMKSEDQTINAFLVNALCTMPAWTPAEYEDGTKVSQKYVLLVGNMENCMINALNIRRC